MFPHMKILKSIAVSILFMISMSGKSIAQASDCPTGYEERTVKCNGKFVTRCVPVNYSCKLCWAVLTPPCPGSNHTEGLGFYNSYERAFTIAEKDKNDALSKGGKYECILNDPRSYTIYLDDPKFCSTDPGSAAVTNLKNKIIPFLKRYTAEIANYKSRISGQRQMPGAVTDEYLSTVRQGEQNAAALSQKVNSLTDANLAEVESELNNALANETQLKNADAHYTTQVRELQTQKEAAEKQQAQQQQKQREQAQKAAAEKAAQQEAVRQQLLQQQDDLKQQNEARLQAARLEQSSSAENIVTALNEANARKDATRKSNAQANADRYREKINNENSSVIPKSNVIEDDVNTGNNNNTNAPMPAKNRAFVYTAQNVKGAFIKTGDKTWGEFNLQTRQKTFDFASVEEAADHDLLYDSKRKIYVLISNGSCSWGYTPNKITNKLFDGYWTILP